MAQPTAVLLMPRRLATFIQYDQAMDLLRSPGVHALEPGRIPYGTYLRLPPRAARTLARVHAPRVALPDEPRAISIFHPAQWPLARELLARHPGCQLWYCLWDRYDEAHDASPRLRRRLAALHAEALERSALTWAISEPLVEWARADGAAAVLTPSAADSFPSPPGAADAIVAVALGNLGWRVDWALLRDVAARMPELTVLLIGRVAEDQVRDDPAYRACREAPNLVWCGFQPDEAAARLMACADVGIVPFTVDPFNDAALPNRVLKAARLGRRTVAPELEGVRTWSAAVVRARGAEAWAEALRAERGVRAAPREDVRTWALEQTGERNDAPLWERLRELGVAGPER